MRRMNERTGRVLLACLLCSIMPLSAADATVAAPPASEIEQLKQMLADQQRQINELRQALAQQQTKQTDGNVSASAGPSVIPTVDPTPVSTFRNLGQVASTTAMLPHPPARARRCQRPRCHKRLRPPAGRLRIPAKRILTRPSPRSSGSATSASFPSVSWISRPCGATRTRDRAWVPTSAAFPTTIRPTVTSSEFRFSPQNSRIGFRIDGDWKGTHFIGYNEFDFNGTSGSTALAVSNGAIVPRLRLYWADVRKGKVEFLAGQSWSMLTPNRNGLSALPGDLFYTQVVDINYMAGLTWTRQPGMRVLDSPQQAGDFRLLRRTTRPIHRRFGRRLAASRCLPLLRGSPERNSITPQNVAPVIII